jgi:hypothetical protein
MSELREAAKEVAALVSPHIVGAKKVPVRVITLRRLSSSVPTLLDDLAAAQGEIERLRGALQMMVDEEVDYMTRNNLGDPEKQHTIRVARSALTLKSEEKQGLSSSREALTHPKVDVGPLPHAITKNAGEQQ